jgi:AraC-like DNA-binding protein
LPGTLGDAIVVEDVHTDEGFVWRGRHPLSVRRHIAGTRRFRFGTRDLHLDECSYLVVNGGEPYAMAQRPRSDVRAITLCFSERLVRESNGSDFPQHLFCHDERVSERLGAIWDQVTSDDTDDMRVDELYYETLGELVDMGKGLWAAQDDIQATNASVREEIYRRLCLAADFARNNLAKPMDIAQLAYVACMSRTHFLRCFKQAFGKSPGEAISEWRFQRAEYLLRYTDSPVAQVCGEVGFSSLSSFIRGFRRSTGKNPTSFRCERMPRKMFGPI